MDRVCSRDNMPYRYQMIFLAFLMSVRLGATKDLTGLKRKSTIQHSHGLLMLEETIISTNAYNYKAMQISNSHTSVTWSEDGGDRTYIEGLAMKDLCRFSTMRIVHGFVLCQVFSKDKKPVIASFNLKTEKLVKRELRITKAKMRPDDIYIMVDENGIWILYQGDNNWILERISIVDLLSIKRIYIDSIDVDNYAIVVFNKLYFMSVINETLTIVKAIDTENTENTMSYKVRISEHFPKNGFVHYNPRLKQVFVTVSSKITYIYTVEYCQFSYPSSKNIDLSRINSTFAWSFVPLENVHYIDLIHSLSTFFEIKDHDTLNHVSDILITCPYDRCLMPGMSNKLFCRLNTIRLLFETFVKQKVKPTVFGQLQVQLDMLKLLEQNQFRTLSNELNVLKYSFTKELIDLKKNIQSFQSKLGTYFISLAEFDNRKYHSDIALVHGIFNELNMKQQSIAPIITSKLSSILKQATISNYAEIAGQIANVAVACAAFVNPFTIFDISDALLEVRDRQAALTKSVVNQLKIDVISTYFPRLKKIGTNLQSKVTIMTNKFPNIKALVTIGMKGNLSVQNLKKHTHAFLKEYDSYRPAFELSTINEYEYILTEIIDGLCEIIYAGSSLVSAVAQGVLASKGKCLATKLDVQNLMGLYRDMYDKQDSLFRAMACAVRATIARNSAESIKKIPERITTGDFENTLVNFKMATLEIIVNSGVNLLFLIQDACTLLEYKNGGVMPEYCKRAIDNPQAVLNSNVLVSSRFDKDMCESDNIKRYVYIPAQHRSLTTKIPQGTIDLTSLYKGDEIVFQIPSKEWLIENNWINDDEKDKMIVLQQLELFIPNNSSLSVDVKSSARYLSSNVISPGGKVYDFSAADIYQYNCRYRQGGEHCSLLQQLPTSPYEFHSCPKLPSICVLSEGKVQNRAAYPSIYSKFGIKLSFVGPVQEPKPKTNFFLMASVNLCIVDPILAEHKEQPQLNLKRHDTGLSHWKRSAVCCGMLHQYYDRLSNNQKCKPCPSGSTPKLGGYYCE